MTWRPTSDPSAARCRARLLERVRRYFGERDVLAVDTPALSRFAVSDPQLESLTVQSGIAGGTPRYLHTSPESCMKRLLAAGYPDIYSICRVFRDGESGRLHQPEFTLIEWYRHGFELDDIAAETVDLIAYVLDDGELSRTVTSIDYRDAFIEFAGIDPLAASSADLAASLPADAQLRDALGDDRDAWLDLVLDTHVAPRFAAGRLTVLRHYPASQAALARLCPGDARVADRFEVFRGPIELANGYVELTDAETQRRRFDADQARRRQLGRPLRPVDEDLVAALDAGLPECAGVALGFERLQMIHDRSGDIRDVVTFMH